MTGQLVQRTVVHPLAWWMWALGCAIATTRSPGIVSSAVVIATLIAVVAVCHQHSPFARAFPGYLALAGAIVVIRVVFHVLVGLKGGGQVLLALPSIPLPDWAGGIQLLGPVSAPGLLAAVSAGMALAALVLCFGSAIALTDPRRTLRSLPASLHLLGTATVIALTLAPQLVASWQRVRRAQGLRGLRLRGWRAVVAVSGPVLQDAVDQSLTVAASMDSRGYARAHRGSSKAVLTLMLVALIGAALGTYALLDGTAPRWLSIPMLGGGAIAAIAGSVIASRRIRTTRYRPDRWGIRESLIAGSGAGVAAVAIIAASTSSPGPFGWSVAFLAAAVVATVPIPVLLS